MYEKALITEFQFPEAHQNIALLYDRLGDYGKAHDHNVYSIQVSHNDLFISYGILNMLLLEMKMIDRFPHTYDQYIRWIQCCDRAIQLSNKTNAEAYFNKGLLERQIGHHQEALKSFQFILDNLDDSHIRSYLNIGNHYFFHDEYQNASQYYLLALSKALNLLDSADHVFLNRKWDQLDLTVSILNNVAQSFREQGLYYQSLYYFQYGYNLLNDVMDHDYQLISTKLQLVSVDIPGLSSFKQPVRLVFAYSKAWMLQSIYTIKGMLNYWKEYEELESLFNKQLDYLRQVYEDSYGGNDEKRKAAFQFRRYMQKQSEDEASLDPYTASLIGFSTWEQDLWICNKVCISKVSSRSHSSFPVVDELPTISLHRPVTFVTSLKLDQSDMQIEEKYEIEIFRVGYLSYDWRDHPMGRLTAAITTTLPKELSRRRKTDGTIVIVKREVHCFSYGKNDGSTIRRFISKYCSVFHDAFGATNDHSVAEYINGQRIHVLVDITGHTYNGRIGITALQPSLVTINYLGYPGVAACKTAVDYTMVDNQVMPPEYVAHFRDELQEERLIYLPFSYQANNMPVTVPFQNKLQQNSVGDKALFSESDRGQNRTVIKVCVFNANKKFEPFSFHSFMNIMNEVPQSQLILLDFYHVSQQELIHQLKLYGILPWRVVFLSRVSWEQHLGRAQQLCDIAMDTFVYGAHTTATDLLFAGIPIFTLRGYGLSFGKMPSRVASSIIDNLDSFLDIPIKPAYQLHKQRGLIDNEFRFKHLLVHDSVQSYESTIIDMIKDHIQYGINSRLSALKNRLMSISCYSPSFDKYLLTDYLDHAYTASFDLKRSVDNTFKNNKFHIVLMKTLKVLDITYCDIDGGIVYHNLQGNHLPLPSLARVVDINNQEEKDKFIGLVLSWNYMNSPTFKRPAMIKMDGEILFPKDLIDCQKVLMGIDSRLKFLNLMRENNNPNANKIDREPCILDDIQEDCVGEWSPWFIHMNSLPILQLIIELRHQHEAVNKESNTVKKLHFTHLMFQQLFEYVSFDLSLQSKDDTLGFMHNNLCISDPKGWLSQIVETFVQGNIDRRTTGNNLASQFEFVIQNVIPCCTVHLLKAINNSTASKKYESIFQKIFFPYRLRSKYEAQIKAIESLNDRRLIIEEIASMVNNHAYFHHQLFDSQRFPDNTKMLNEEYLMRKSFCHHRRDCIDAWEGFVRITLSFLLDPQQSRLMDIGMYAMKVDVNSPFAFILTEFAVLIDHHHAHETWKTRFPSLKHGDTKSFKIAFYCNEYGQSWWPKWGPHSFQIENSSLSYDNRSRGVGGSEEAVYFLAIELARLGYRVDVYGDITNDEHNKVVFNSERDFGIGQVRWLQMSSFNANGCLFDVTPGSHFDGLCYDVFIAWRYSISLILGLHSAKQRFLWLHDLVTVDSLPPIDMVMKQPPEQDLVPVGIWCHGIWVQSEFHSKYIRNEYSSNVVSSTGGVNVMVVPNGIPDQEIYTLKDYPLISDGRNDIFVYGSAPNRGLQEVLELWHNIRNYRPNATLHIYYGFTPKALDSIRRQFGLSQQDQHRFEEWMKYIKKLMEGPGVVYHGHVNHQILMEGYANAGFLLYPTSFPETGCITMIRAMIAGVIPITSKFANSVLSTLGEEFDMGPSGMDALNETIAAHYESKVKWLISTYVPRVFEILDIPSELLERIRYNMTSRMRKKYSWSQSAKIAESIMVSPNIH